MGFRMVLVSDGGYQSPSSIMNEKIGTSHVKCGSIPMKGSLRIGDIEEDEDHAALTDTIHTSKKGNIYCIIGHAKS